MCVSVVHSGTTSVFNLDGNKPSSCNGFLSRWFWIKSSSHIIATHWKNTHTHMESSISSNVWQRSQDGDSATLYYVRYCYQCEGLGGGGSGAKLPMGETMPRTSVEWDRLSFPTRKQWPFFMGWQQTGVFLWQLRTYSRFGCIRTWGPDIDFRSVSETQRESAICLQLKVLIRSGHNLNQTRDIPLVSVTICQMWQITPIFPNQEHHPIDSFRTKSYCFCGIAR